MQQERMIRFLQPGHPPKNLLLTSFDMTASEVFALGSGGGAIPDGHMLAVNGAAAGDSRIKPGDTVALQPRAGNG